LRFKTRKCDQQIEALRKTAEHLAAQPKKKQDGEVVEMPENEAASR
jgi:hypothetical protein